MADEELGLFAKQGGKELDQFEGYEGHNVMTHHDNEEKPEEDEGQEVYSHGCVSRNLETSNLLCDLEEPQNADKLTICIPLKRSQTVKARRTVAKVNGGRRKREMKCLDKAQGGLGFEPKLGQMHCKNLISRFDAVRIHTLE